MSKNSFEHHYGIGRVEIVEVSEDDSDEYDEDDLGIAMRRDEHINMESIQRIINGVVPPRQEDDEEEEEDEDENEEIDMNEEYSFDYNNVTVQEISEHDSDEENFDDDDYHKLRRIYGKHKIMVKNREGSESRKKISSRNESSTSELDEDIDELVEETDSRLSDYEMLTEDEDDSVIDEEISFEKLTTISEQVSAINQIEKTKVMEEIVTTQVKEVEDNQKPKNVHQQSLLITEIPEMVNTAESKDNDTNQKNVNNISTEVETIPDEKSNTQKVDKVNDNDLSSMEMKNSSLSAEGTSQNKASNENHTDDSQQKLVEEEKSMEGVKEPPPLVQNTSENIAENNTKDNSTVMEKDDEELKKKNNVELKISSDDDGTPEEEQTKKKQTKEKQRKKKRVFFKPKPPVDITHPRFKKPLDHGWVRELVYRNQSKLRETRLADVYYYTPLGKKIRSTVQLKKHLTKGFTLENFTFAKESLGINDGRREFVRNARKLGGDSIRLNFDQPSNPKETIESECNNSVLKTIKDRIILPKRRQPVQQISESDDDNDINEKNENNKSFKVERIPEISEDSTTSEEEDEEENNVKKLVFSSEESEFVWSSSDEDSGDGRIKCSTKCLKATHIIPTIECIHCKNKFHPNCIYIPESSDEEDMREIKDFVCQHCTYRKIYKKTTKKRHHSKLSCRPTELPTLTPLNKNSPEKNGSTLSEPEEKVVDSSQSQKTNENFLSKEKVNLSTTNTTINDKEILQTSLQVVQPCISSETVCNVEILPNTELVPEISTTIQAEAGNNLVPINPNSIDKLEIPQNPVVKETTNVPVDSPQTFGIPVLLKPVSPPNQMSDNNTTLQMIVDPVNTEVVEPPKNTETVPNPKMVQILGNPELVHIPPFALSEAIFIPDNLSQRGNLEIVKIPLASDAIQLQNHHDAVQMLVNVGTILTPTISDTVYQPNDSETVQTPIDISPIQLTEDPVPEPQEVDPENLKAISDDPVTTPEDSLTNSDDQITIPDSDDSEYSEEPSSSGINQEGTGNLRKNVINTSTNERCNCKGNKYYLCHKILEPHRALLSKKFWANRSWEKKKKFLSSMIVRRNVTGNAFSAEDPDDPDETLYYLKQNGALIRVCKKMFLSTLRIGEWSLNNLLKGVR